MSDVRNWPEGIGLGQYADALEAPVREVAQLASAIGQATQGSFLPSARVRSYRTQRWAGSGCWILANNEPFWSGRLQVMMSFWVKRG
jgi:hypothetical protein